MYFCTDYVTLNKYGFILIWYIQKKNLISTELVFFLYDVIQKSVSLYSADNFQAPGSVL